MNLYTGVNYLLAVIGEIPVDNDENVINADLTSDVGMARDILLATSEMMQVKGYWFNKELQYPLVPNENNKIPIGEDILSIVDTRYIVKDHRLYDTQNRTDNFTDVVKVDLVFKVEFDDLPLVFADTVVRESQVQFYNNTFGDTQELKVLQTNAQRAEVKLQQAQYKHRKANLISGSRLTNRKQNPVGVQ